MVRVISVHNFLKQDISSIDELIDLATAPPNILLLVQSDHTISVRDLSLVNDTGYNIPTVDQVVKIIYSIQGNYIGTLEKKSTRSKVDVNYIRIYLNWESLRKYEELPPMRARIAGRVTPLSQNHEGLEMIEIPAQNMPDNIACCPISGNLIMSSKNAITIYKLKIQMHDISKIYFIDFELIPVDFLLSFVPTRIQFVENVVAVQNDEYLHVFRIVMQVSSFITETKDKELSNDDLECLQENSSQIFDKHSIINYENLLMHGREAQLKHLNDGSKSTRYCKHNNLDDSQCELTKISNMSLPIQHDFPTITAWKALESKRGEMQKQNPFLAGQDLVVNMINLTPNEHGKIPYRIENILQYQLMPMLLGSSTNRELQEKFTCLSLKPYYSVATECEIPKPKLLESDQFGKLQTIACFFGTQQEGYLYCFRNQPSIKENYDNCVVYPFTAPVLEVKLEDFFLHAITDTGLETYTMRAAKHLIKNNDTSACPFDDPVCLIGLRPFVNVFKMCITNDYLLLFANNEESSKGIWTLYKLNLPSPSLVWSDFLSVAEENKWEAPATYNHLVGEGHLILMTYLDSSKWISQIGQSDNHVHLPVRFVDETEVNSSVKLYNESCALLGDFHIMNGDFLKSSNYYKMCGYKTSEIVKRAESLIDGVPEKFRGNYETRTIRKGLIYHLKKMLALYDEKYATFTGNREEFYSFEIGSVVNILLDYLEKDNILATSDLILDRLVLREFSTYRILKIMKNVLSKSSPPREKDALSLALMCIQRDQTEQAKKVLQTMSPQRLQELLLQYHHLLFENCNATREKNFSELTMVLIETYPIVTGKILSYLVTEKRGLNLSTLLKIFLEILPSGSVRSRNSSVVLQIVLENYFKCYFKRFPSRKLDFKATEALKILIRIYLTFLKQRVKGDVGDEPEQEILFREQRRGYLQQLPPFGAEFTELLSPKHGAATDLTADKELNIILLKIQSLLSYQNIPPECLAEVRNYITNQTNVYGSLSLQVASAGTAQDGVLLLVNFAPQAVVQYTKECLKELDDWKFLIKQIQLKIGSAEEGTQRKFFYQQILTDVLLHGAKTLEIEDLVEVLPRDLDDSDGYLTLAQNNAQANHIRTLIMTTGKQLQTILYDSAPQKNSQLHT